MNGKLYIFIFYQFDNIFNHFTASYINNTHQLINIVLQLRYIFYFQNYFQTNLCFRQCQI